MRKLVIVLVMILGMYACTFEEGKHKDAALEQKIDKIISQLTLEEKVAMCHANSTFTTPGVERMGIPELKMTDGPHGVRAEYKRHAWEYADWRNDSATAFPALTALAATFNPEVSYKYGVAIGEEARYRGKDILLGPGVNIYRTPLNGRNFEYMGEDPYLASVMAVPWINGVQSQGVASCLKHYVLNNQEQARLWIDVELSERALHEIYMPAFKACVEEGELWSIMASYNKYQGQQAAHNEVLINDILKGEWGFDGVVVSDWGATHDTKEAAYNGLDLEMGTRFSTEFENYYMASPYLDSLRSGVIVESTVDEKVRRILRLMFRTNMAEKRPAGTKLSGEHFDVAREVATEAIVLLKNEDDFFPLDPSTDKTIAVIGENATRMMTVGGGSSDLLAAFEVSPLEGIKERFTNATIIYSMGYSSPSPIKGVEYPHYNQDSLRQAALKLAASADIVLFMGGLNKNEGQDCENLDRESYGLPFGQNRLIEEIIDLNSNTGLILLSGNAYAMPWIDKLKGVMQAWYLGSMAGHAIADVVSGDVNPSGKLPFSFPVKLEDNGAHAFDSMSYPGNNVKVVYKEDILVGYRWHDTKEIEPLFEFGFGLSYTDFELSGFASDRSTYGKDDIIKLSLNMKNTGSREGAEVVQIYVHDSKSSVPRPVKELKAFKKVRLKPGESRKVELEIAASSLAFYDDKDSRWKLEEGDFVLICGTSSRDIKDSADIEIK